MISWCFPSAVAMDHIDLYYISMDAAAIAAAPAAAPSPLIPGLANVVEILARVKDSEIVQKTILGGYP